MMHRFGQWLSCFSRLCAFRNFPARDVTPYELQDYPYVTSRFPREKWQVYRQSSRVEWLRELAQVENAIRSTLTALFYDAWAKPRWVVLLSVLVLVPICAGLQAIAPRASDAKTAMPFAERSQVTQFPLPSGDARLAAPAPQPGVLSPVLGKLAPLAPAADLAQAKPFFFAGSVNDRDNAITCLAAAAWYEAGNDPEGQRSVIQVILNRLKHPSFPKTICGVVLQGSQRSTGCQFTFTCDGSLDRRRPPPEAWSMARLRAQAAMDGAIDTNVLQATHYHADYVTPWWSHQLERLAQVGRHIFYRWPGAGGQLSGKPSTGENVPAVLLMSLAKAGKPTRTDLDVNGRAIAGVGASASVPALPYISPMSFETATAPSAAGEPFGQTVVMAVDNAKPSGHWAVEALARCSGQLACQVFGYADASAASHNAALSSNRRDRPDFMLIRDKSSGMTLALWDCKKNARPSNDQCLPDNLGQLRLSDRSKN